MNFELDLPQTTYLYIALGLVGAGLSVLLCAYLLRRSFARKFAQLESEARASRERLLSENQTLEVRMAAVSAKLESAEQAQVEWQGRHQQAMAQCSELEQQKSKEIQKTKVMETQLTEREQSFNTQLAQFEQQKLALNKEFELLAHKIFEEKGRRFDEQSKSQMDAVLKPFQEQISGFQKRVNEVHIEAVQGHSKIEAQIKNILEVGLKMSDEAQSLAQALKGDKKAQGNWSEVQAELLLEMAGLKEGREYRREQSLKTEDGRDQRPDFIINLPNEKHIIVDSKISLNAYVQAVAAETEEEQKIHVAAHVNAIRQHVRSLSDKNYARLLGINSLEYIFMFIGSEPAYLAAANEDPALFQDAYRKGIAIVTPNTLLSSLRIVSHLWSIDKQNANTRKLAEQASKVYDKFRVFAEKMQKLGAQISTVQKTYDESWNTLKDGRGSLAKQVDKFVDMGVSVKEKLPADIVDEESVTDQGD